jgi:hypothetical protein
MVTRSPLYRHAGKSGLLDFPRKVTYHKVTTHDVFVDAIAKLGGSIRRVF